MRLAIEAPTDRHEYEFVHGVRVRFVETDAMGIVHHSAYLPYFEEGRVEYLRWKGHPYTSLREEGFDMTVLEVFLRCWRPLRFDDRAEVGVKVAHLTRATMQIAYCIWVDGEVCTTGVTVHGCVDAAGRARRLPAWTADLVMSRP